MELLTEEWYCWTIKKLRKIPVMFGVMIYVVPFVWILIFSLFNIYITMLSYHWNSFIYKKESDFHKKEDNRPNFMVKLLWLSVFVLAAEHAVALTNSKKLRDAVPNVPHPNFSREKSLHLSAFHSNVHC